MNRLTDKAQPNPTDKKAAHKNLVAQLLSPATSLAILGTAAFIFSFYRAGQLANLVIPKDEIAAVKENAPPLQRRPKIDINSQAIVDYVDSSEASMFIMAGDYKLAAIQAMRDLTCNPPDNLPTILEAGDILSQFGTDKELAFGLLERAVSMAPNNQYITLRYCKRLLSSNRSEEAEAKLEQLIEKYPQWYDPKIVLSKLHFLEGQKAKASTELVELSNKKNLTSRQLQQIGLMLAQVGRLNDGFALFEKALKSDPKHSFYAAYCQDWIDKNPTNYDTALAMVKANLIENKNSANVAKQTGLEIKHAALLLLLARPNDAAAALEPAVTVQPKNYDLNILLAAAYGLLGQNEKAKESFADALLYYQPKM